jgi:hypothetical protein
MKMLAVALAVLMGALVALPSASLADSPNGGGDLEVSFRVGEVVVKTITLSASENGEDVFIPADALPTEEEIAAADPEGRVLGWIVVQGDGDESGDTLDSRIRGNDNGESGNDSVESGNDSGAGDDLVGTGFPVAALAAPGMTEADDSDGDTLDSRIRGNDSGLPGNDSGGNDSVVKTEYTADAELIASGAYADITKFAVTGDVVFLAVGVPGDSRDASLPGTTDGGADTALPSADVGSDGDLVGTGFPVAAFGGPGNDSVGASGNDSVGASGNDSGLSGNDSVDGDSNTDGNALDSRIRGNDSDLVGNDSGLAGNDNGGDSDLVGTGFPVAAFGGPGNDNGFGIVPLGGIVPLAVSDIGNAAVNVAPASFQTYDDLSNGTVPPQLRVDIQISFEQSYTAGGRVELPLNFVPGVAGNNPSFYSDGNGHTTGGLDPFFTLDETALNAAVGASAPAGIVESFEIVPGGAGASDKLVLYLKSKADKPDIAGAKQVSLYFDFNNNYKRLIPTGTVLWNVAPVTYVGADAISAGGQAASQSVVTKASHNLTTSISKLTPSGSEYVSGTIDGYFNNINNYFYETDLEAGFVNRYGFVGNLFYIDVPAGWTVTDQATKDYYNCVSDDASRTDGTPLYIQADGAEVAQGSAEHVYDRYYRVISAVQPTTALHPDYNSWQRGGQIYNIDCEYHIAALPPAGSPPADGSSFNLRVGSLTQRVNSAARTVESTASYTVTAQKIWDLLKNSSHGTTGGDPIRPISARVSSGTTQGFAYAGPYSVIHPVGIRNTGTADIQGVYYEFSQKNNDTVSAKVNFNTIQFRAQQNRAAMVPAGSASTWTQYEVTVYVKDLNDSTETAQTPQIIAPTADGDSSSHAITLPALIAGQYISKVAVVPLGLTGSDPSAGRGHLTSYNSFTLYYTWKGWPAAQWPDGTEMPVWTAVPLTYYYVYDETDNLPNGDYSGSGGYTQRTVQAGDYNIIYTDAPNAYARMVSGNSLNAASGGTVAYEIQGFNTVTNTIANWENPRIAIRVPKFMSISSDDLNDRKLTTTAEGGQSAGTVHGVAAKLESSDDTYNYYSFAVTEYSAPRAKAGVSLFTIPVTFRIDPAAIAGTYPMPRVLASTVDAENFLEAYESSTLDNLPTAENANKIAYGFGTGEHYRNYTDNTQLVIPTVVSISNSTAVKSSTTGGDFVESSVVPAGKNETVELRLNIINTGNSEVEKIRLYNILPRSSGDPLGSTGNISFKGVTPQPGGTVYYTTADPSLLPKYDELGTTGDGAPDLQTFPGTAPWNGSGINWTQAAPGDLSTVTAIFIVFDTSGPNAVTLSPGESVPVVMSFEIPAGEDQTVLNKFRYSAVEKGSTVSRNWNSPIAGFSTLSIMVNYRGNKPSSAPAGASVTNLPASKSGVWHTASAELNTGGTISDYNDYESLTLSSDTPTLAGYAFGGWYTKDGSDGGSGPDWGDEVSTLAGFDSASRKYEFGGPGEVLTLHAKWLRNVLAIAYDVNEKDADGTTISFPVNPVFSPNSGSTTAQYNGLIGSTASSGTTIERMLRLCGAMGATTMHAACGLTMGPPALSE